MSPPINSTTSKHIAEARLMGQFDALYEAGGVAACLRIITILTERLAQQIKASIARGQG